MKWEETSEMPAVNKYVSGRWTMDWRGTDFFLCNFDILLCPVGVGVTEREAFENMLKNIAEYEQQLKRIRAEIQEHLNELKGGK